MIIKLKKENRKNNGNVTGLEKGAEVWEYYVDMVRKYSYLRVEITNIDERKVKFRSVKKKYRIALKESS